MKINTMAFQQIITPQTRKIDEIFRNAGFEIRIVGGAVRDSLLNIAPKDVDFCTDATPDEMMPILRDAGAAVIETGLQHGTITAVIDSADFEITTLRADVETDGRHADVEFIRSFEEDAARRDLTINAMSADLDGNLFDYFGGQDDLENRRIKFVGDPEQRITEDYLRILRYYRFAARFGFDLDMSLDATLYLTKDGLKGISGERIWMEMSKIVTYPNPDLYLGDMTRLEIGEVIGFVPNTVTMESVFDSGLVDPVALIVAGLMDSDDLENIITKWKWSNDEKELGRFLMNNREKDVTVDDAKRALVRKGKRDLYVMLFRYLGRMEDANTIYSWTIPAMPVSGDDLMERGMKQGKELGQMLETLRNAWCDSDYKMNFDELMEVYDDKCSKN